jgi:glycosyltransferase involved in cell wall biosynthesis
MTVQRGDARTKRPLRILHCPNNVGGNPGVLARAERELGLESKAISLYPSIYGFDIDECFTAGQLNSLRRELGRWRLLWQALRYFDVIHFNFGETIIPFRIPVCRPKGKLVIRRAWDATVQGYRSIVGMHDLPILRMFGKGIVVTFQGDDARQGDYCRANFDVTAAHHVGAEYYTAEGDAAKRRAIKIFGDYADQIYALNPDLLHVLPDSSRFLPYANVDPRRYKPVEASKANTKPVVLHAPTHRSVKGTEFILTAIQKLRSEGVPFEFVLVEGLRHEEAIRLYSQADIFIDQLLIGWYGGAAVEVMALAKPVICYVREDDLKYISPEMKADLPIIKATPQSIYEVLKRYLTHDKEELAEIGKRSRQFIEKWHDPRKIALTLETTYENILHEKRKAELLVP